MKLISCFEEAGMDDIAPSPVQHIVTMVLSQVASSAHHWCHADTDFPQSLDIPHQCNILTTFGQQFKCESRQCSGCEQPCELWSLGWTKFMTETEMSSVSTIFASGKITNKPLRTLCKGEMFYIGLMDLR